VEADARLGAVESAVYVWKGKQRKTARAWALTYARVLRCRSASRDMGGVSAEVCLASTSNCLARFWFRRCCRGSEAKTERGAESAGLLPRLHQGMPMRRQLHQLRQGLSKSAWMRLQGFAVNVLSSVVSVNVLVVLIAAAALGKGNSVDDVPMLVNSKHSTEESVLTVYCSAVYPPTRPRRAACSVTQFMFNPMSADRVREKLAEIDVAANGKGNDYYKEVCAEVKRGVPAGAKGPERPFLEAMVKACSTNDKALFWEAHRRNLRDVEAKTCDTMLLNPENVEFEQVDANTWRSVTSGGTCSITLIRTIWRKAGESSLWTYQQVRSVPPSANQKLCPASLSTTSEFSWRHGGLREVPCRFIK
jgi:hypothetical protein